MRRLKLLGVSYRGAVGGKSEVVSRGGCVLW